MASVTPRLHPRRRIGAVLLAWLLAAGAAAPAGAQDARYTVALRGLPLADALEQFVRLTGAALAYDPALVEHRRSFCTAREEPAEELLRCILRETGLDYFRLSSGTYALTPRAELPPRHGYVAGLVSDGETGSPIPYAHVVLAETGLGAVTNEAGQFALPPLLPGAYRLRVSHVGYDAGGETVRVTASRQTQVRFLLRSAPVVATPVVIDAVAGEERADGLGRETVGPGDPGAGAPPGEAAGASLARGAHALPGLRVNDLTADAHIQGGDPGEHQLRLDGAPVFLPRGLLGLVGPFGAFSLERITVHKAGFGAAEGSQITGLLLAEHAVETGRAADVQLDPLSLNGRVEATLRPEGAPRATIAAAGRVGLGGLYRHPRLQQLLERWSGPDLFLLAAALPPEGVARESLLPGLAALEAEPDPGFDFSDVHLAGRLPLGPLRTLHASFYEGRQRLGGQLVDSGDPGRFSGGLTVADRHRWLSRAAQLRYHAVWGSRTLAAVQLRYSRYRLDHAYRLLYLQTAGNLPVYTLDALTTYPIRDGNGVREWTLAGGVDHARDGHALRAGVEATHTAGHFDLLLVGLPALASEATQSRPIPPARHWVQHAHGAWRLAAYGEDRLRLGARTDLTLGLRLTLLPERGRVFAEPRVALRRDGAAGRSGSWSMRTAAGLYRQFLSQHDLSTPDAGALLPSVRIWLPVDATVEPPLAWHLTHALLLSPRPAWNLRLEGFYRLQPHSLVLDHRLPFTEPQELLLRTQDEFLTPARLRASGLAAAAEWHGARARLRGSYELSRVRRQSDHLFDGRWETVPWNEPHRLLLGADWLPRPGVVVGLRWRGVWGRSWGFRQAYYDYFGHHPRTRSQPPFDLGAPSQHRLPPLYQLDASAAFSRALGPVRLQLRAEVLNLLGRENVAEWRLAYEEGALRRTAIPLYPTMPSAALRVTW